MPTKTMGHSHRVSLRDRLRGIRLRVAPEDERTRASTSAVSAAGTSSATAPLPIHPKHAQDTSLFFGRLPAEIRELIYTAYLNEIGPAQHVFTQEDGTFAFCGCVTDHEAIDDGRTEGLNIWPGQCRTLLKLGSLPRQSWQDRLASPWGNHWRCREAMVSGELSLSPMLGLLLACRRMYDEFNHVLLQNLAYVFTDYVTVADAFLTRRAPLLAEARAIKMSFGRAVDLRDPGHDPSLNRWHLACEEVDKLQHLQTLHVWFDTSRPSPCFMSWWTATDWYSWTDILERQGEKLTISLPAQDDDFVVEFGRECSPKSAFVARGRFHYRFLPPETTNEGILFDSDGFVTDFPRRMGHGNDSLEMAPAISHGGFRRRYPRLRYQLREYFRQR